MSLYEFKYSTRTELLKNNLNFVILLREKRIKILLMGQNSRRSAYDDDIRKTSFGQSLNFLRFKISPFLS